MALTKDEILRDLRKLGLREGSVVMVHSALSALGEVDGGADTIIEALIEAVGSEGTLLMPAMAGEQPFRTDSSPSRVGIITERFRSWPGAKRSLHPTHSATAYGPLTDELLDERHVDQPTALGADSPWGRIAQRDDSYILLLGVDQDRNTLLHSAEEAVDSPYLSTIQRTYIDTDGIEKPTTLERFPGPHRDFIGLDPLFKAAGIMKIGKIGNAVSRLMKAKQTLELAIAALEQDPAAVLCDNPHCRDCVLQRAAITSAALESEDFTLSAIIDDTGFQPADVEQALWAIGSEGIRSIEIGPQWMQILTADPDARQAVAAAFGRAQVDVTVCFAAVPMSDETTVKTAISALHLAIEATTVFVPKYLKLPAYVCNEHGDTQFGHAAELIDALAATAADAGVSLLISNAPDGLMRDSDSTARLLGMISASNVSFSFNPAHFAQIGEHPFLKTYHHIKAARYTAQLIINDGCKAPWPAFTTPGQGQAEVKELMSILRCRSFSGLFTIAVGPNATPDRFSEQTDAFWHLLNNM